ncbi:MAG: cysG [Dehalococcoidia bacterium]|nr:cysG [Dehalococcoidia bacterium]
MPSRYYPAFLDIKGRQAVIVGGGSMAETRAEGLVDAGARVTVISPRINDSLAGQLERGYIAWLDRQYQHGDLHHAWLAIAATDDASVNAAVAAEAGEQSRRGPFRA